MTFNHKFRESITGGSAANAPSSIMSSQHNGVPTANEGYNSLTGAMSGMSISGHTSLPSRMGSPINVPRRKEFNSSFRSKTHSGNSGHSSLVTYSQGASGSNACQLEAHFRFRHSGGVGFQKGQTNALSYFVLSLKATNVLKYATSMWSWSGHSFIYNAFLLYICIFVAGRVALTDHRIQSEIYL